MGNWRDIFLYAYDATEGIDEMAAELKEKREARMKDFREHKQEAREKARVHWEEHRSEMQEKRQAKMKEFVNEANLATKEDIESLKKQIAALEKKLAKQGRK